MRKVTFIHNIAIKKCKTSIYYYHRPTVKSINYLEFTIVYFNAFKNANNHLLTIFSYLPDGFQLWNLYSCVSLYVLNNTLCLGQINVLISYISLMIIPIFPLLSSNSYYFIIPILAVHFFSFLGIFVFVQVLKLSELVVLQRL